MYGDSIRADVKRLSDSGLSDYEIARMTGIARSTIPHWRRRGFPAVCAPARRCPAAFIRGLIHSDGSRCINRFTPTLPSGRVGQYAYVRYFFTNYSADIRRIFCEHCEILGIRWTRSNSRNISISHRDSVAILEAIVGAKA